MREKLEKGRGKKESILKETLVYHFQNNAKEYFLIFIIFTIGIVLGVIFINKIGEEQKQETTKYVQEFVTSIKNGIEIDSSTLLKDSIQKNVVLGVLLWFIGSTIIGVPFIYVTIAFRGFCLGYTISSIMAVLNMGRGLLFCFTSTFLQNLLFIPCVMAIAVSGVKFYKAIVKEKKKDSIKQEMRRHTIFSCFCVMLLIIASFIETYISTNLLMAVAKYL